MCYNGPGMFTGNDNALLQSFYLDTNNSDSILERRMSIKQDGLINKIIPMYNGIFTITTQSARFYSRGGQLLSTENFSPAAQYITSSCQSDYLPSQFYISGSKSNSTINSTENGLGCFDCYKQCIVRHINTDRNYHSLESVNSVIGCSIDGNLSFHDPRSLRQEASIQIHHGTIKSMKVQGNLVVVHGYQITRSNNDVYSAPRIDPLIKLYDIRTHSQLPPITFTQGGGPQLIEFVPKLSNTLCVVAANGNFKNKFNIPK